MTKSNTWRTVDIEVTAAIAIVFAVVFVAWNVAWNTMTPAFAAFPPAQNIFYGIWFIPAVLAALIVQKPGAALFAEIVAASFSTILGSQWGLDTLLSGAIQGGLAEIVFGAFFYSRFDARTAALAAVAAAIGAWIHDVVIYWADLPLTDQLAIGVFMIISAVLLGGLAAWWIYQVLRERGVLSMFPSGRQQTRV